ncbi:MAG: acyl-ACP--UDP-N-acetylglucosamine O-acyltransferase [Pseudomonadota bacterium]
METTNKTGSNVIVTEKNQQPAKIDPRAIIDPSAKLADNTIVGPYSIIGADVEIGEGTEIGAHVTIKGPTKIGKHNKILQFASIGEDPQDLKYQGESVRLEIGDHNTIREFCTINRGTKGGGGITKIGNNNFLMSYVHIAHDCILKNHIIIATHVSLAGHITVDDYAIFGGFVGVHQYCYIGAHSFSAAGSLIPKDVLPFTKVSGYYAKPFGLNNVGLRRRNFSEDTMAVLKQIYKIIYRKNLTVEETIVELSEMDGEADEVGIMIEALKRSQRGIVR